MFFDHPDHFPVERRQVLVFEVRVIHQRPLPPGILVAPVVSLAGEIDPFRVAEVVAHEGHICLSAQGDREQPDHFMKCDTPVDHQVGVIFMHVIVHLLIHEPESKGFVAHQRLVVRFGVSHRFYMRQAVVQHMPYFVDVPVFIPVFLEQPDPEIGDTHAEPVIKAQPPFLHREGQPGHTGNIFRDGDGQGAHPVDQRVNQLQVGNGIPLHPLHEVFIA